MVFEDLKANQDIEDEEFDLLYPKAFRKIAKFHFTPVRVAIKAAIYLANSKTTRILDIGSGLGKFCMIGSVKTKGVFTGVEFRKELWTISNKIAQKYKVSNVEFIYSNITEIDFKAYDAFYLFNSFYENIDKSSPVNDEIKMKQHLYQTYSSYVRNQLDKMPKGTRVVTYFSYMKEIPESYKVIKLDFDGKLKMMKKIE
ncbi:MAG: methyltransferase domain-containing protein [Saprospiraceae bacterium]